MTHHEYLAHVKEMTGKAYRPCTAADGGSGGRCYNCGYDPTEAPANGETFAEWSEKRYQKRLAERESKLKRYLEGT